MNFPLAHCFSECYTEPNDAQEVFNMAFPIDAIKIDFDTEIEYGQDQAFVSYPTVFPTVTFMLEANDELIKLADQITGYGKDAGYEFMIGINPGFPEYSTMEHSVNIR